MILDKAISFGNDTSEFVYNYRKLIVFNMGIIKKDSKISKRKSFFVAKTVYEINKEKGVCYEYKNVSFKESKGKLPWKFICRRKIEKKNLII